jgi:galactose oxidase
MVNGFSYTPRQDGNTNGNIGTHSIEYSLDGNTWTTSAQGTWANDQTVKTTLFTPVVARWIRLTATSEASNTGKPFSSASEIHVLTNPHSSVIRSTWTVSADSSEIGQQSFGPTNAIDSGPTTMWHTQWNGGAPALPHWFKIDQGAATSIGGLSYLPRPGSGGPNGRIGQYTVQKSDDGNNWADVASGTWADTTTKKFVEWAPVTARYWRLVAKSEAGNRGPWTSAGEINLLDGTNQLANFIITVDSEETAAVNNSAVFAMDSDINTFWHTQWAGNNVPGFPHFITIDMATSMPVKALQYTPRQDDSNNGNIGQHKIEVSMDGNAWTMVATGNFADNNQVKLVNFQETTCRFVRLTATSEAGNRGPWISAADIALAYDTTFVAPAPQTKGQWALTIDFPVVPVAMGSMYNTGGVLAWSSYSPQDFGNTPRGQTVTALYDPASGQVSKSLVSNTNHDMFCPGISLDFNGQLIVTGGNDAPRTSLYVPQGTNWNGGSDMNIARGYQASATLSNGWIFTIGGSWSGGTFQKNGEFYNPDNNVWTMLDGADVTPMLTNDAAGMYRADNHAWLFGWKNQAVFQAGPSRAMNWYTTTDNGGVSGAGTRSDSPDAMCGIAVMFDAVAGKILTAGGSPNYENAPAFSNSYVVTIGDVGSQTQTQKVPNMTYKRVFHNGVALPNGQVFVVGGQDFGQPFSDDSSIMYPEIFTPSSATWAVMAPMAVPRNYHSVAILMNDATVLIGGGGLCNGCDMNHYDGQIFVPPYLFTSSGAKATRPVINSISTNNVRLGDTLTITMNGAASAFSIVRLGTTTHTVNTDQRRIPLTPTNTGGNTYRVTIPSDAGVAIPGYWMLFGMDANGVPSISKTIKITT